MPSIIMDYRAIDPFLKATRVKKKKKKAPKSLKNVWILQMLVGEIASVYYKSMKNPHRHVTAKE